MDFQHRAGGKTGSGGVASASESNRDRRERLRQLALETINLAKDPYFMKNHLGTYECKLCLTLHNNEGSYLAHTQGKKHQSNLARRAARENQQSSDIVQPIKPHYEVRKFIKIGRPGYKVTKQRDPDTKQQSLLFQIDYPEISDNIVPKHRFMSGFEQHVEAPDRRWQYLLFAAEPYETISFKIPSREVDKSEGKFWTYYNTETKQFFLQFAFKLESNKYAGDHSSSNPRSYGPAPPAPPNSLRAFDSKENEQLTTYVLSSSLDYSHDYYTRKRIEQLNNRMDDIQISSFLKFINYHLSSKTEKKIVKDLSQDLSNGHILIDLIEIFSSKKLKREYGHTRFHSLTNVQYVLDYLKLHMNHINISPHDIVSGNRKQILALLWIIMKIFDFPSFHITTNKHIYNENIIFSFGQDRNILLKWINNLLNKILNTNIIYMKDFYIQTWIDNIYLSLIIKYLCPCSLKYGTLEYFEYIKQLDELNLSNQKQYFQICLNLSNYCFNTITIIDYTDRTEKSLYQFFSELKQNILFILKSNHIGKLTKTNPYTKQLYDTVLETTNIEYSQTINQDDDDDYLIYDEHKQKQSINELNEKENSQSLTNDSCNDQLVKQEENTISTEKLESTTIETINSEESVVDTEPILSSPNVINITQEQPSDSQNLLEIIASNNDENFHNQNALKSRKIKKKKSTISMEKLTSTIVSTPTSDRDLIVKIIECLRNRKLITFKYIFILACLCFSILIIFIHK
ncbi:unnamed protein product [Rotaria sp. Silwood1]|nr:unnamed protein product [Rotaria sp. Silwood1]